MDALKSIPPLPSEPTANFLKRDHVLFTSVVAFAAASLYFLPGFPFHGGLCAVALVSGVFHLGLCAFFPWIGPPVWNAANLFNIALLGFALHYSGGILSPFTVFLIFIFISGAGYGINYPLALAAATGTFLVVIGGEFWGVFPPLDITPAEVYASWPMTLLIILTLVGHMYTAGSIYRITVKFLWGRLKEEHAKREEALGRLSKLEAPSQLGMLVAKITHDMRGPLGALKGFVCLMRDQEPLSPAAREDCEVMLQELDRVAELLNRIVGYVKPGQAPMETLDPVGLMENVLAVLAFYPSAKNARITRRLAARGEVLIRANKEHLQQIFFNILKNAVEAMVNHHRKELAVEIARAQESAVITLRDEGPGIEPELLERLARESVTTKKEGGGMGLMIANELVGANGGTMEISSAKEAGTTVVLRFPLARAARADGASKP